MVRSQRPFCLAEPAVHFATVAGMLTPAIVQSTHFETQGDEAANVTQDLIDKVENEIETHDPYALYIYAQYRADEFQTT